LAQRLYQIASGYADGNDANSLRHNPLCTLGVERWPLAPAQHWARAPPVSRLEHRVDRTDVSRFTQALVDHFVASDPAPPGALVLDLAHTADPTHGQQECTFSTHYSKSDGYVPLRIFAGTSQALVRAGLRPGKRPTGGENARLLPRLLRHRRAQWPEPPLRVRGDRHLATPELIDSRTAIPQTDVVFGLAATAVWLRQAAPVLQAARRLSQQRPATAPAHGARPPARRRLSAEFSSAAASWSHPWRVVLQAEVMAAGATPRCVVPSLTAPAPPRLYEDLSGARSTGENLLQAVQCARHSDRTSETTLLAHAMRCLCACAASGLPHALRTQTWQQTARAHAQPATVILTRCKVATLVKPYTDRMRLQLPSRCPVKGLRHRVTVLLALPLPGWNTSESATPLLRPGVTACSRCRTTCGVPPLQGAARGGRTPLQGPRACRDR
jgi:Transposase DDE domain group 1